MGNRASPSDKKDQAKRDTIGGIVFLSLVVIGILIAILYGSGVFSNLSSGDLKINSKTGKVIKEKAEFNPDITENPDISYPGYGELNFVAEKIKQNVSLNNPQENTCHFVMSLMLSDGRTIWKSDYLEPGCEFSRIELSEALEKGNYERATLKYDSFSIRDGRKLNGSSINLTIKVN